MTLAAVLPLALHARPRLFANIGIGSGLTSHVILTDREVKALDTIEIEPLMAEAARLGFMPRVSNAFEDPRSHIHFDDAKTFFATHRRRYDVIVSEPSNPWVSGVATLFSAEFYKQLTRYLERDGMLVQWVQIYETDMQILSSIILALAPHFSDFALYHADDGNVIIVAVRSGRVPMPRAGVFSNAATSAELARVGLPAVRDIQARYIGNKEFILPLAQSYAVPANSDYFPFVDLRAIHARITRKSAIELPALSALPVPLFDLLQRRAPTHQTTVATTEASSARDAVVAQAVRLRDALVADNYDGFTADATRKVRSLLRSPDNCALAPARAAWLDAVYFVASLTGPALSLSELSDIWSRIYAAPCVVALQADERGWLDLMRATASRDTASVLSSGARVLESRLVFPTREQFLFALTATSAAALAEGQPQSARALLDKYRAEINAESSFALALRLLDAVTKARLGDAGRGTDSARPH